MVVVGDKNAAENLIKLSKMRIGCTNCRVRR